MPKVIVRCIQEVEQSSYYVWKVFAKFMQCIRCVASRLSKGMDAKNAAVVIFSTLISLIGQENET